MHVYSVTINAKLANLEIKLVKKKSVLQIN